MREVDTNLVKKTVKELILKANVFLSPDIKNELIKKEKEEKSEIGKGLLNVINENIEVAASENCPICQDTGMCIVFLEVGQDVIFKGNYIYDEINEAIREAYDEGYFRKSVVGCPLRRENTKDNTPGIIYYNIVKGDKVSIKVMPKGFGSENCGATKMLKPADGYDGVIEFILDTVKNAGSKPCPPMIIGVGIGGTMEKSAIMAKEALLLDINHKNTDPYYAEMEKELYKKINNLGIGPGGLGGTTTALGVNILTYPTHIAGLPVSVNIGCHVSRHTQMEI
ncbi:fumarate hydratase [Anaerofustis stercorihominis]|uniref:fumarate hydratase n=1 Tax=Anaerofustis stercorihominis TaxID=214853 RepID=UPI00214B8AEB|nr:fumarate hydratase [Anaerofustis stercorihominis]MCR2032142.1 fumarate hydratase [Anaerofustis stercorihominis]